MEIKEPHVANETDVHACKACGNRFEGKYCNRCGEKVIHPHDRSIAHFLEGVFHVITHADSKMLKNLKLLVLRPGLLSKNYIDGIRQPFAKPIPMFFVANLIYFLFPVFETFNTSYNSQVNHQQYSAIVRPVVEKKLLAKGITEAELAEKYNAKTSTYSKLLLILFVPMFAVGFAIVNFRRDRYFADHLVAALEFMCFTLFYNTILWAWILLAVVTLGSWLGLDLIFLFNEEGLVLVPVVAASTFYFLLRMQRTLYGQKWWLAVPKAMVLFVFAGYVVTVYRFILFHATMFAI